jgi:hypothetical protein
MSVFSFIGCLLKKHEPMRRNVTWDGRSYVGHCRHCGSPIQRHGRRNWRKCKDADQPQGGTSTPT